MQAQPGLQTIFTQAEDTDEEEHFVDAKDTDIAADSDDDVHNSDHDDSDDSETPLGPAFRPLYNPFRREPQLAGAQLTGLWEIHSVRILQLRCCCIVGIFWHCHTYLLLLR